MEFGEPGNVCAPVIRDVAILGRQARFELADNTPLFSLCDSREQVTERLASLLGTGVADADLFCAPCVLRSHARCEESLPHWRAWKRATHPLRRPLT